MAAPLTEAQHAQAIGLDTRPDGDVLLSLLQGQKDALMALDGALPDLAKAAELMQRTIEAGGRLIYAAAGSSGLMALADAAELGGTYGIATEQVGILMAGGLPVDTSMPGASEDDAEDGMRAAQSIFAKDTVIALSASGGTAYPMAVARMAKERGAAVICIANNQGAAMFQHADVAICLATPPEMIAGSTRMGAGTAQKVALNMMSTLMGVRLGHVYDGLMVNLVADNDKLRLRAAAMICQIADVDAARARDCLAFARGSVKLAVLLAEGAGDVAAGELLLKQTNGNLRAALAGLPCRSVKPET